ncbi:hypothetical protein ACVWXO_008004 [Bradyrhizobium sp. LM2.7]
MNSRAPLPNLGHLAPLRGPQERMASNAWAIRIATLTAIRITSIQVITFVSSHGVERAQPRTVKNNQPETLIRRWGEVSTQLLRPPSAL